MPSSSSSARDPTPPPPPLKDTNKKKPGKTTHEHGGPPRHCGWEYTPPPGVVLLQGAAGEGADAGEFDWDAVAGDEDVEMWLIRVPESIKPKYLENMMLEVHDGTKNKKNKTKKSKTETARIGTLRRKHATFDIWSMPSSASSSFSSSDDTAIGGEETQSLSCLLPRKSRQGILYPAPRPIARHLIVSAQPATPTPAPAPAPVPASSAPRERHPREALTHAFVPYGSLSRAGGGDAGGGVAEGAAEKGRERDAMDVDGVGEVSPAKKAKGAGKKRKGEAEAASEKRPKKAKTA
ncbi:hypothetical protein C0993_005127 [Termitomyces sp. T159_Od127]|nr:hypothetical protein C0993_005127 [Termitomyces sp. T159_Od127]